MTTLKTLYFDYNATTPVDARVLEAMLPYFDQKFGNSMSSAHSFGWDAEKAVEKARAQAAHLLNCEPRDLIFTSGATESNNWAIEGLIEAIRTEEGPDAQIHFLISPVEHASILAAAERAKKFFGVEVDFLPINSYGQVEVEKIETLLKPHTRLLAAMWVQNEVGSINPIQKLSEFCHAHKIYFLSDATQAVGKVAIDLKETAVDLLTFSAHKLYGPKGIGFLYRRPRNPKVELPALIAGGGHERGFRSGTLNVPAIVGLGVACEIAQQNLEAEFAQLSELRDLMFAELKKTFPELRLNGHPTERAANNLHLTFTNCTVPAAFRGLAISRGSACHSGKFSTSHTLKALKMTDEQASQSLRISMGRMTSKAEIFEAVELIRSQVTPKASKLLDKNDLQSRS